MYQMTRHYIRDENTLLSLFAGNMHSITYEQQFSINYGLMGSKTVKNKYVPTFWTDFFSPTSGQQSA